MVKSVCVCVEAGRIRQNLRGGMQDCLELVEIPSGVVRIGRNFFKVGGIGHARHARGTARVVRIPTGVVEFARRVCTGIGQN